MFSITIRERSGQVYTFHFDKPEVLIGRVKGNDVILPKQNISKRHAMVRVHGGRFVVEDLGSTNGTYVNGHRIGSAVEIGGDDKVYLGDFVMNFVDLGLAQGGVDAPVPEVPEGHDVPDLPETDGVGLAAADGGDAQGTPLFEDQVDIADLDNLLATSEADYAAAAAGFDADFDLPADPVFAAEPPPPAAPHHDESTRAYSPVANERMTGPIGGVDGAADVRATLDEASRGAPQLGMPGRPAVASERAPTRIERAVDAPDAAHFDALAVLYRNAMRDLRPAVPSDAAQMSDTDWVEMEDRVVAFVDAAVTAGDVQSTLDVARLKRDLIYELAGLGPLEPMLDDAEVEAIEVNGPAQIFVFRQGRREPVAERFSGQPALAAAVDRLVRATGIGMHRAGAHADGTLVDGTSVRVVWPPLCPAGPAVVLRKPRTLAPTMDALVERGMVSTEIASQLTDLVGQRRSIALCGLPASGRRTVLNALGLYIGEASRIVVVEDGLRLRLPQEHVVRLDSAATPDAGPSVLHLARRLMPDWLLLGETAAMGTADLFTAALDGLPPWIGCFYGHSVEDFLARAVHAIVLRHPGLPEAIATARVVSALDAVAVFTPGPDGTPVLGQVYQVRLGKGGVIATSPLGTGR